MAQKTRTYNEIRRERFTESQVAVFWSLVEKKGPVECWLWKGCTVSTLGKVRYGRFSTNGRQYFAHRVAYVLTVGEIPEGLTIDHVKERGCTTGLCCNPAHLEPVTQSENSLRYYRSIWTPTIQCTRGHAPRPRGEVCRPCRSAAVARTQKAYPEKYREIRRLQKRKERARQRQQVATP